MKKYKIIISLFIMLVLFSSSFEDVKANDIGVNYIKDNWINYQDYTGSGLWTVYTDKGVPTLGTRSNVAWTGYVNPEAYKTVNATFEFDFYHDADEYLVKGDAQGGKWDNDNIGWTFRHNFLDGNTNRYHQQEYYAFVMRGPYGCSSCGGSAPSRSGLYKKLPGGPMGSAFDEDNTTPYPYTDYMQLLAPINMVWQPNRIYKTKIQITDELNGSRIQVWVDGTRIVNFLDRNPIPMGSYGPFTHSLAYGYFKNVKVNNVSVFNAPPRVNLTNPIGTLLRGGNEDKVRLMGRVSDPDREGSYNLYYSFNYPENGTRVATGSLTSSINYFDVEVPIDGLKNGYNTLYVWATDSTGAISDKIERTIVVDNIKPNLNLSYSPYGWTNGNVTIDAVASDSGYDGYGGFDYIERPNGSRFSREVIDYVVSSNGTYTFNAYDILGNKTTKSVNITNIDKTSPVVTADVTSTAWGNSNVDVNLTFSDTGSGISTKQYAWSSSTNRPSSWGNYTGTVLRNTNGTWYLHYRAVDNAGNEKVGYFGPYRIDKTKPTVSADLTSRDWDNTEAVVNLAVSDSGGSGVKSKRYALSNSTSTPSSGFNDINGPITMRYDGTWYLHYEIEDNAGNITKGRFGPYRVAISRPNVMSLLSSRDWGNTDVRVVLAYADNGGSGLKSSQYAWSMSTSTPSSWNTYTGPVTQSSNGIRYLHYRAADNAGNVTTGYFGPYKIDKTNPTVSANIVSRGWDNDNVIVNLNTNDSGGSGLKSERYTISNSTSTPSTGFRDISRSITISNEGTWYLHYELEDNAGNNVVGRYGPYRIDKTNPTNSINVDNIESNSMRVNVNPNDSLSGLLSSREYLLNDTLYGTVSSNTFIYTDLVPNTRYKLTSRVRDNAGNVNTVSEYKYTRALNPLGVDIVNRGRDNIVFNIIPNDKDQGLNPSYKLEVRKPGSNKVENTKIDNFSKTVSNRTVEGLDTGEKYELWVYTRNEEGLENSPIRVLDEFILNNVPEISLNMDKAEYSENEGHNRIEIKGQVRDLDEWDSYEVRYVLKRNGSVISNHNNILLENVVSNDGNWKNFNKIINVDSSLSQGDYELEVTVIDSLGETDSKSYSFEIDKTNPLGTLKLDKLNNYDVDLSLSGVEDKDVGLHSIPLRYQYKLNDSSWKNLTKWVSDYSINSNVLESNSKYDVRGQIRDKVLNIRNTNTLSFVTAPKIVEKEKYYREESTNTIEIEWENALTNSDNMSIEIRRSGELVAVVDSGNKFIDSGLSYERDYNYELEAVYKRGTAEELRSNVITKRITTGFPVLQLELFEEYDSIRDEYIVYSTVFSNKASIRGEVYYDQGGNVELSYDNKSLIVRLGKERVKEFRIEDEFNKDSVYELEATLVDKVNRVEVNEDVRVKLKEIIREKVNKEKFREVYGN